MTNNRKIIINSTIAAIFICAMPIATIFGGIVPFICGVCAVLLIIFNYSVSPSTIFLFIFGVIVFSLSYLRILFFNDTFFENYLISFFTICIVSFQCIQYQISEKQVIHTISIFAIFYLYFLPNELTKATIENDFNFGRLMTLSYSMIILMESLWLEYFIVKRNWMKFLILAIFSFYLFQLLIFGSRGTLIALLFFFFTTWIIKKNISLKKVAKIFGYVVIPVFLIIYNGIEILASIQRTLSNFDIHILFIDKTIMQFESGGDVTSGRDELAEKAIDGILNAPILGNGIASFENTNNIYVHNLFLQLFYELGFFSVLLLFIVILFGLYIILNKKYSFKHRIFISYLFSAGIIQLFFSSSIWLSQIFWIYLGYIIKIYYQGKNDKELFQKHNQYFHFHNPTFLR